MSYTVKWIPTGDTVAIKSPQRFVRPAEAIEFACTALDWHPVDIWVEDDLGTRIATRHVIEAARRARPTDAFSPTRSPDGRGTRR
ncbi:MAG TPA: hypothetical protein VMB81_23370 [Candidatus Sulfotelmatobacter sp.]|nr:hypothetical protein [Candidatus Sulfotelmatobacter sp.]